MKYKVRYIVEFTTEVECEDPKDLQDAVCDVDIPETKDVTYVEDSFDVISVEDENNSEVDWYYHA